MEEVGNDQIYNVLTVQLIRFADELEIEREVKGDP